MKRLHKILLLLFLTGCNKAHQMGIRSVGDSVQEHVSSSDQPSISANQVLCTASGGHLLSFIQEDGIWVATVDKKLPPGFSSRFKLPVHCAAGFSVEGLADYSPREQQNLIHIERMSGGQDMVYVGSERLPGGGKWHYNMCSKDGCRRDYIRCHNCGWKCNEGSDGGTWGLNCIPVIGHAILAGRDIANREHTRTSVGESLFSGTACSIVSLNPLSHLFNESIQETRGGNSIEYCELHCRCACDKSNHIVLCPKCYACPHCSAKCKQCCGCSNRITAEKERERKRREEEEREAAERRRREEERNRSYYSYTPSTSYQDREAERKRKEEEARKQRFEAARRQASSGVSTTSNIDIDVSSNTRTSGTSSVTRNQ